MSRLLLSTHNRVSCLSALHAYTWLSPRNVQIERWYDNAIVTSSTYDIVTVVTCTIASGSRVCYNTLAGNIQLLIIVDIMARHQLSNNNNNNNNTLAFQPDIGRAALTGLWEGSWFRRLRLYIAYTPARTGFPSIRNSHSTLSSIVIYIIIRYLINSYSIKECTYGGRVGPRVGSGQTFCRQSRVGSGQRFAAGRVGSKKSDPWTTLIIHVQ